MTPWAMTQDMADPLTLARHLLGETDQDTATLSDAVINSTVDVYGWQQGISVLAQTLVMSATKEVKKTTLASGTTVEFWQDRITELKSLRERANRGQLPEPGVTKTGKAGPPGSIVLGNAPKW